jgi:hypothetical protein
MNEQRDQQNGAPQISKGRTRGRQTAHVRRSDFKLTHAGEVFEGGGGYVVVMKGKKWAKGWSLFTGQSGSADLRAFSRAMPLDRGSEIFRV